MTRERYESISLHDLREIAKNRGMRRISTLKKAELIDAMMEKDAEEAKILLAEKAQRREAARAAAENEPQESPESPDPVTQDQQRSAGTQPGQPESVPGIADREEMEETGETAGSGRSAAGQDKAQDRRRPQRGQNGSRNVQGSRGPRNAQSTRDPAEQPQEQSGQAAEGQSSPQARRTETQRRGNQRQMNRGRREDGQAGRPQRQQRPNAGQGYAPRRQNGAAVEYAAEPGAETGGPGIVLREGAAEYGNGTAQGGETSGTGAGRQAESGRNENGTPAASRQTASASGQDRGQEGTASYGKLSRYYQPGRPDTPVLHKDELNAELDSGQMANGILEVMQDGFGFIRCANYMPGENDIYVAPSQIRRFGLKTGDIIVGNIRVRTQGEKFSALLYVKSVNGFSPEEATRRYNFEDMTPIFPDEKIRLERPGGSVSMRIMDLISPVGKGQRGMIVSPPKAGKTTLLKDVARAVKYNNPEIHLIVLLIDERPEEVTDIREAIEGPNVEVIYSTFDELPEHHKRVSEMAIERARRLVEHRQDVMILLDSITRLTRAYNLTEPSSGRTLSGGLDPAALHMPKRFFGAARNMREGGSLTILATALIETGSKMDDIVFEEFKGTGNMELVLDRKLSERRIFPAIDIVRSGTRRDDLLLTPDEQNAMSTIRRAFNGLSSEQAVTQALDLFSRTRTNGEFVNMVRKIQWGMTPDRSAVIKSAGSN